MKERRGIENTQIIGKALISYGGTQLLCSFLVAIPVYQVTEMHIEISTRSQWHLNRFLERGYNNILNFWKYP